MFHLTQMMMMICILSMRLVLGSSLPKSECDGAEYITTDDAVYFQPAGICMVVGSESNMYVCNSEGDDISHNLYYNRNCSGDPKYTLSMRSMFDWPTISNGTITCCSGNQCNYGIQSRYEPDDNCIKTNVLKGKDYYYTDICAAGQFNQCRNNIITTRTYRNNENSPTECTGDPSWLTLWNRCDSGVVYEIECGLTAIDTCKHPTQEPTTPSPTTPMPTTPMPTTPRPTTASPTTVEPTTASPTTVEPTTPSPTTPRPTTSEPTSRPTTSPTTVQPTTASPTTHAPTDTTTQAPITTEMPFSTTDENGMNGCSTDKECGFAFICVDGSCIRDCDAFDIEGYLECSSSFANVQNEIIQINSKISMIDANIANLSIKVNILDQRSNWNQWAIAEINDEILVLHRKSNDTNDRIERFSVNPNVPFYSAQGVVNGPIDNPFNFDNNPKYETQDILMMSVLLINMVIGIYNCMYKDNKSSKGEYQAVKYETGDEGDILIEQPALK